LITKSLHRLAAVGLDCRPFNETKQKKREVVRDRGANATSTDIVFAGVLCIESSSVTWRDNLSG